MSPGDLLLKFAFVGALAATALFVPALRGRKSGPAAWVFAAHALLLVLSLTLLWWLFLAHRFEYEYVAQYSSRALSPALTFAASWAGQEGSILLWVTLAAVLGVALLRQPGPLARPAMFFVSLLQSLLMVLLLVRSPFRLSTVVPQDGQGLNPLLEDPWMVVHPPVLFIGYAALALPFALGLAALVRQEYKDWNRMVWPWALFGVVTLGAGIVLGGIWAYKVLGWGGYWGWDPVENASLIPWLVAVALLHGLLIQRTTGGLVRTNLALAGLGWVTVVAGTYLTRSGVLQDFSVHSFTDLGLNGPLKAILLVSFALPAVLLARRWAAIDRGPARSASLSRESALWLGLVTVLVLATLVAVGTTAPVYTALAGNPASVRPAFYEMVALPLGIALVLLMALAPALRWSRQQGLGWVTALVPGLVLGAGALVAGLGAGIRQPASFALLGTTGIALGVNAVWMVRLFRRGWAYGAGHLGHVGIAVMVLGMALAAALGRSERVRLVEGVPGKALGYELTYRGETIDARGEHILTVELRSERRTLEMHPRIAHMPRGDGVMRKPGLSDRGELYLAVIETQEGRAAGGEPAWLEKGVELVRNGVGYTFSRFRMESHEDMKVFADIQVRRGGVTEVVSPGLSAGPGGTRPLNAQVPGLGELHVARIDADRGRVAIVFPPAGAAPAAVVELSTHPFVNLIWIGALLTLIGSAMAGLRRAAERAPGARPPRGRDVVYSRTLTPAVAGTRRKPEGASPMSRDRTDVARPRGAGTGDGRPSPVTPLILIVAVALATSFSAGTARSQASSDSTAPPSAVQATPPAVPARAASMLTDTTKAVMFLREMVVTGARYPRAYYESPQALSFVSRAQMLEQAPTVLGDVLGTLPGVDMSKDSPWEQRPILRGLGGQRVLVMMDGSPINSARGNGPHPSLLDPAQVDRIEVVRGPSSVAYGSDALGGAINIITRDPVLPEGERFRGSATVGGSTVDDQRNGYVEVMPRLGKLTAFLSGGGRRTFDYNLPSEGGITRTVPNSRFEDYNALANLRYTLTPHMALRGSYQLYRGKDIGLPGLKALAIDPVSQEPWFLQEFSFPEYDRDAANLSLEHEYPDAWLAKTLARVYMQREHRNFFSHEEFDTDSLGPHPPSERTRISDQDRIFDLDTYGFQTQFTSRKTDRYRLSAGLDLARDKTDGDNVRHRYWVDAYGTTVRTDADRVTASVPDGTFDSYASYLQSEWYLAPRWTVSAGGRFTYYRYRTRQGLLSPGVFFQPIAVNDGAVSGSLGVVYSPIKDLHLTANVANGYRQPNAQDLFFNGPASVGTVLGNPDLNPERSVSYDLGLRWGPGDLGIAGNLFYSTFDDLIDAIDVTASGTPPGAPRTYRYVNITNARIWGGDLEAEYRFLRRFQARVSMAGAIGDITNADAILRLYGVVQEQAPLPSIPPFKGAVALRWRDASGRFWIEPSARWSWRTNRLPLPTPGVSFFTEFKKEWMVGDLMAGVRLPAGQRAVVGVRNIADRAYRQAIGSIDEPGRSFVGSLTVDF